MSPIDDELRAALHSRAFEFTPSPDPLAGIERRAKRIRRNRVAASVTGTVLAVAAIALAVPSLTPTAGPDRVPPPFATTEPSASPEPAPSSSRFALDPTDPWPYRGNPDVAVQGDLDAYTIEWAVRHRVLTDEVRFTPLFGRIDESSTTPELFYVATLMSSGASWWGVAQATESGPGLALDVPLARGTTALPAALPGDEVARLLVVASPEAGDIQYGPDAASEWATMTPLADGVAITPLEGDPATDQVRVLAPDGAVVFLGPAPGVEDGAPPMASPSPVASSPPSARQSPAATSPAATPPAATPPAASGSPVPRWTIFR